jgi:hypothetical protein
MGEQSRRIRSKYASPQIIERTHQALKRCGCTPTACQIGCDGSVLWHFVTDEAFSADAEMNAWEQANAF